MRTKKILWEYEDQLEIDMTDGMFWASKIVDGVRMHPYVVIKSSRYYLEVEPRQ